MNSETHPYAGLLGIQAIDVGKGTAVVRAKMEQAHTNHIGVLHHYPEPRLLPKICVAQSRL
jgi:acyl-coenzyme A thioesterase PaaI-like protein